MQLRATITLAALTALLPACSGRDVDAGPADAERGTEDAANGEPEMEGGALDGGSEDAASSAARDAGEAARDATAQDAGVDSAWSEPALRTTDCPMSQVICNGACLSIAGQRENGCTLLATGPVPTIVSDGPEVYFVRGRQLDGPTSPYRYELLRFNEDDQTISTLVSEVAQPLSTGLALDSDAIYYAQPPSLGPADGGVTITSPGRIWRVPRSGGQAVMQLDGIMDETGTLDVARGRIYFGDGTFTLSSVPIGGGAVIKHHTGADPAWHGYIVDDDRLFFDDLQDGHTLRVAPLADLMSTRDLGQGPTFAMSHDRDAVYVARGSWNSQLWVERIAKSGGAAQHLSDLYAAGEKSFSVVLAAAHAGYAYVFRAKANEPFALQRTSRQGELQTIAALRTAAAGQTSAALAFGDKVVYLALPDALLRVDLP